MPRLSFRRPVENTLRKLQADPQITVSRRLTDWKRDLNAEESRKAKRNESRFSFYESHPPTYIHPQHPERKNTREATFRFYESVPPTYIGPEHPARTLLKPGILQPAEPPVAYIYSDIKFQKKWAPSFEGQTIQILRQDLLRSGERQTTQKRDISPLQTQSFSHTASIANMSDDAYSKFLEGANDTGATTQESKSYKTKSVNTNVPKALESVEEYYSSDADEPFEPVSLEFEGSDISAGKANSISVSIFSPSSSNPLLSCHI
jgi:hypothetical protein